MSVNLIIHSSEEQELNGVKNKLVREILMRKEEEERYARKAEEFRN